MQTRSRSRFRALAVDRKVVELPLEIVEHIITVSTPLPAFDNHRSNSLLPLCLVHSSLTRHAQRLLLAHPYIKDGIALALFLRTVEWESEDFKTWVKSLRIKVHEDHYPFRPDVESLLVRVIAACRRAEKVRLDGMEFVDLASLLPAAKLRVLSCQPAFSTFTPIGIAASFATLRTLELRNGSVFTLTTDALFFDPIVLPSLTRLLIDTLDDGAHFFADLYGIAGQLQHVSFRINPDNVTHLLARCSNLRSLNCDTLTSITAGYQFDRSLVGIRIWTYEYDEETTDDELVIALNKLHSSGLLDSTTVVFLPDIDSRWLEEDGELKRWLRTTGLIVHYGDGKLEKSWRSVWGEGKEEDFSHFADWVDAEVLRRSAVERARALEARR